jgi:hypothetical protein
VDISVAEVEKIWKINVTQNYCKETSVFY